MFRGLLGFSTGLVALCAFISCFGALNLLNRIDHVRGEAAAHVSAKLTEYDESRCQRTIIIDDAGTPHLTWLELFYMKWTVVFTLLYSFVVMLLIRAKYVSSFDVNFMTANVMLLVGGVLTLVLLISTVVLNEHAPFVEVWCNDFIVYFMYLIALKTCVSGGYFLICSCHYYFELRVREL